MKIGRFLPLSPPSGDGLVFFVKTSGSGKDFRDSSSTGFRVEGLRGMYRHFGWGPVGLSVA